MEIEITELERKFYPGYYNGKLIPHGPFLEEWIDVENGYYMVSNYGRIKSLSRKHQTKNGSFYISKELILKPVLCPLDYVRISISINGHVSQRQIHRLVAIAFIPNPLNKPHINHIRGFTGDNIFTQIEWSTEKENKQHSIHFLKTPSGKKGKDCAGAWKPIIGTNMLNGESKIYQAVKFVKEDGFRPNSVSDCLKGNRPTHKGFKWKYKT